MRTNGWLMGMAVAVLWAQGVCCDIYWLEVE